MILEVERPALSAVVTTLVRKGFVDQAPDATDQRQRMLALTAAGRALWETLPELAAIVGAPVEASDEPLAHPWAGRLDGALARELGCATQVPSVRQAVLQGAL